MSGLDLAIIAVVLFGLWRGFQHGLIKTSVSLCGWFVALVAGSRLATSVGTNFASVITNPVLQMALGFLTVVLAVLVLMHLIVWLLNSVLAKLRLTIVDRLAGGVLGAAKNTIVVLVLMSIMAPLLVQMPVWQSSVLASELMPFAPLAKAMVYEAFGVAWQHINQPA